MVLLVVIGLPILVFGQASNTADPTGSAKSKTQPQLPDAVNMVSKLEGEMAGLRDSMRMMQNSWNASLSSQIENQQRLQNVIDENRDSIETMKKSYDRQLKHCLKQLNSLTDTMHLRFRYLDGQLTGMKEAQAQAGTRTDSLAVQTESKLVEFESSIQRRLLINGFVFVVILGALILGFIKIRKAINSSERGLEESLKLDTMLSSILENQLRFKRDAKAQTESDRPEADLDHSLPIKVGEEIYRMRLRITHMDENTKGVTALKNSLTRLEDEFNSKGYAIKDFTGQAYIDEMTSIVKGWEPKDEIGPGEQKIIRMIRPQILHNDVVVSPGEIVVGISISDSTYSDRRN